MAIALPARIGGNARSELLLALENARTRLAVAVAAERKSMPASLWRDYLKTESRARQLLRTLRGRTQDREPEVGWRHVNEAIRNLRNPPQSDGRQGEARRLCGIFEQVLDLLESEAGDRTPAPRGPHAVAGG